MNEETSDRNFWHKLVLHKLKGMVAEGNLHALDDIAGWPQGYDFEHPGQTDSEDAALTYFERIGMIRTDRTEVDEDAPSAAEEAVWIIGIDFDKFATEVEKFGLRDDGLRLVERGGSIKLPQVVLKVTDSFSIHQGNLICYEGRPIELEPQVSKIVVHIMGHYPMGHFTSLKDIIDNCLGEAYKEQAGQSGDEQRVQRYVRRCISKARASFRAAAGASSNKDFFPSKPGVGYIFEP